MHECVGSGKDPSIVRLMMRGVRWWVENLFPLVLAPRPLVCGPAHGPVQFLMSCDGQLLQIMYRIGKHRHASAFLPPTSLSFAPCLFTARRLRRFWGLQLPAASARFFGWDGAHAALPATRVETKLDDRSFFPDDGNYTFFWSPAWQSVIVPDITPCRHSRLSLGLHRRWSRL